MSALRPCATARPQDSDRPRHRPGVTLQAGGEGTQLVDPDGRKLHQLNATALALWELCDGETTVAEMVAAAGSLFGSEEVLRADIEGALAAFAEVQLIVWDEEP